MTLTFEDFKNSYLLFARKVMQVEKSKNTGLGSGARLLTGGTSPEELLSDQTLGEAVEYFYSLNLPGLNRKHELNPAYTPSGVLGMMFSSSLKLEDSTKPILMERLLYPLDQIFARHRESLDEENLCKTLEIYFACWKHDVWIFDVAIPVYNLDAHKKEKFGKFILIDKAELKETSFSSYRILENHEAKWFLYLDLVEFVSGKDTWEKLKIELTKIVTGLRLVTNNRDHMESKKIGLDKIIFTTFLERSQKRYVENAETELRVANSSLSSSLIFDPESLGLVVNYLSNSDEKYSSLNLAIRRFNFSFSREQYEDQLIDLIIAAESSLLFKMNNELRLRFALRGSAIASSSFENTQMLYDLLALAYDMRSAIVHSGAIYNSFHKKITNFLKEYQLNGQEFLAVLREVIRNILLILIEKIEKEWAMGCNDSSEALKNILNRLDKNIIKSVANCFPVNSDS